MNIYLLDLHQTFTYCVSNQYKYLNKYVDIPDATTIYGRFSGVIFSLEIFMFKKNYRETHKMDYMLFARAINSYFFFFYKRSSLKIVVFNRMSCKN